MNLWQKFLNFIWFVLTGHWPEEKYSRPQLSVQRYLYNPILSPIAENNWEAIGVLNPAVIQIDGKVHMLYRAIGSDGVSRIGYASSSDGLHFDERLNYPVFVARNPSRECLPGLICRYDPVIYPSGGSWGGCEDPRMVEIDKKIYVTFNAFDGWDFIRVGLITLKKDDFLSKRWHWDYPVMLSPEGQRHKNWILFPEKINDKFAILHSIFGETDNRVRVEYTNDLKTLKDHNFESVDPHQMPNQKIAWHHRMRSAGSPPIKTTAGWLIFYQAMEESEPHRYKIGAKLLDLRDPQKVIARALNPILEPNMYYENDWKPDIVYVCGSLVKDNKIFLYYGGGDKYICVATAPLDKFLYELRHGNQPKFSFKKALFK